MAAPRKFRRVYLPRSCSRRVREIEAQFGKFSDMVVEPVWFPPPTMTLADVGTLKLVREAGPGLAYRMRCSSPAEVFALLAPRWSDAPVESFLALLLDAVHNVLGGAPVELSRGTADETLANPRDLFRVALVAGATSVVLAHNHPSGDPTPSDADRHMTVNMCAAGRVLGIRVVDHVVIGRGKFVSMAEMGLM